jgi:hypothetical protein
MPNPLDDEIDCLLHLHLTINIIHFIAENFFFYEKKTNMK